MYQTIRLFDQSYWTTQRTFPISFLMEGVSAARINPAINGTAATLRKRLASSPGLFLKLPAISPPKKLPKEIARNHTPIIRPPIRCGASLVVVLRPTGLKQSSPTVWQKSTPTSHHGPTLSALPNSSEAITNNTAPNPTNTRPNENFAGLDGWRSPIF